MVPTQLSVAALYESVWQTPLKTLATRWQVHPHSLGQLLDTHRIPRPYSGYWTQKALGKVVTIPSLPEDVPASQLIDLSSLQGRKREKTKPSVSPLPPPRKSLGRYPLLKGIKGSLHKPHYPYEYLLTQRYGDTHVLQLDVSAAQRDRAIAILHTLMSVFDQRGWPVKVEKPEYGKRYKNVIIVDEVAIAFRLRERLKQHKRELSEKEKQDKAHHHWVWKETLNVPTGDLQLYIESPLPHGMKAMFEDKAALTLENQLGIFVENVIASAAYSKVLDEERRKQQRQWQQEQARRADYERSVRVEQQRIETFLTLFSKWQRANQCRAFIEHVLLREKVESVELEGWLGWSEKIADALDPLNSAELRDQIAQGYPYRGEVFEEALSRSLRNSEGRASM